MIWSSPLSRTRARPSPPKFLEHPLWEYVEFTFAHTPAGNAYDEAGSIPSGDYALFTHEDGTTTIKCPFFWKGSDTYAFRFTPTKQGWWTYETFHTVGNLDGHVGSVLAGPNTDPLRRGFFGNSGNKFTRQDADGVAQAVQLFVYMNEDDYETTGADGQFNTIFGNVTTVRAYLDEVKAAGCTHVHVHVNNHWFELGNLAYTTHTSEDPDPATFAILETILDEAALRGLSVHFWPWGDNDAGRLWTQVGVGTGINGDADTRLWKYIAARLGAIPNWTSGYGFDVYEWVTPAQITTWADSVHSYLDTAYRHLLCARDRDEESCDVVSYGDGAAPLMAIGLASLATIIEDIDGDTARPHLYEERNTYQRTASLTMEGTLRQRNRCMIAGGVGDWFGAFVGDSAYPNPEWLKTSHDFWESRFRAAMVRDAAISDGVGALRLADTSLVIVYVEGASTFDVDLSNAPGALAAVAVDCKAAYSEDSLGNLAAQSHTGINLGSTSDWLIAIGDFS